MSTLVANDDTASTVANTPVNIPVLANDTLDGVEPSIGDLSSMTISSPPTVGSAVVEPDGTITYTPPAGFCGQVTFQYTIEIAETACLPFEVDCDETRLSYADESVPGWYGVVSPIVLTHSDLSEPVEAIWGEIAYWFEEPCPFEMGPPLEGVQITDSESGLLGCADLTVLCHEPDGDMEVQAYAGESRLVGNFSTDYVAGAMPISYATQWQFSETSEGPFVDIAGATELTLVPAVSGYYRFRVSATNVCGSLDQYSDHLYYAGPG